MRERGAEIATYDAIEALAEAIGDTDTAALARAHRRDEERMLADLRALIPALTAGKTAKPPRPTTVDSGQATVARLRRRGHADDPHPHDRRRRPRRARDYESRHRRRVAILEAAQQALTG